MIALPALLVGRNLGETVWRCVVALIVVAVLAWVAWTFGSARWYAWRAETWKDRAVLASQRAEAEALNAKSANQGAENATQTRSAIDAGTVTVRVETEQSAQRIEAHVPSNDTDAGVPDPDVMRELQEAETRTRAASRRLQRASAR